MRSNNKNTSPKVEKGEKENTNAGGSIQEFDRLSNETDKARTRKPGSQGNSSRQGNNGRGGGK